MRFEDLKELGTEAAVRAGGKYNTKGKEYEVQVRSFSRYVCSPDPLTCCLWRLVSLWVRKWGLIC